MAPESPADWELTLCRSVFPGEDSECRLRVLRPALAELPASLKRTVASVGGKPGWWGDRPCIRCDPHLLLAALDDRFRELARALEALLARRSPRRFELDIGRGRRLRLGDPPAIFGVLNVTPDSFSDGGQYLDPGRALDRALEMVQAGADAIDVGGESTRPGAAVVETTEELKRVGPVIRRIRGATDVPISIDTTKAEVARRALEDGADIINDISALEADPEMVPLARESGAGLILMHRQGTPRDMQDNPRYHDVNREVYQYLANRVRSLEAEGLDKEKMVVDPGIGFGKRVEHNLALLRDMDELRSLGRPILVGASRKSFLRRVQRPGEPGERGKGSDPDREASTLAAHATAILGGASALRVHRVESQRDFIRLLWAVARGDSVGSVVEG